VAEPAFSAWSRAERKASTEKPASSGEPYCRQGEGAAPATGVVSQIIAVSTNPVRTMDRLRMSTLLCLVIATQGHRSPKDRRRSASV
jgi:hypothetical protein